MELPVLPKISIGTAGFGNEYGKMLYGECKQIIDKALLNRINYIDTSPYYGDGLSEEIVGKCLKHVSRDRYIISTSTGRYSKTKHSYRYYDIINSVMNSIKVLGVGYIDIIFINDIEYAESLDDIIQQSIPALLYLKKQGYIKYIGIASFYLDKIDYIVKRVDCINYILSYGCYTLLNNTLNQYAPHWNSLNIQIIQGGVTNRGLLTPKGHPSWYSVPNEVNHICNKIKMFCNENNINLVEKCFYHTLSYKRISTILVGVTSAKELNDYLSWVDNEHSNNKAYMNALLEMALSIRNNSWLF